MLHSLYLTSLLHTFSTRPAAKSNHAFPRHRKSFILWVFLLLSIITTARFWSEHSLNKSAQRAHGSEDACSYLIGSDILAFACVYC